ncbi:M15 family metallopeptidase [Herbivorax sp. ANBcel31]|uniref:M15 family metallopeptidase n=1 Tax=Herbivorax sp. ANBcel31 TaxID=3069754 RepID=UPI003593432E
MKRDILSLMMAYPEHITGVKKSENGKVYIVMKSGNEIIYDDEKEKSFDEKIYNADLQDMLEELYPLWDTEDIMEKNTDPGRIRVYSLFKEVYGDSQSKVSSNLENVFLGGSGFGFNSNNNASKSLQKAFEEISALAKCKPEIYQYVFPVNGTFNYRFIAGTNLLSPHAFGIAVDLKSDSRDYWKWATPEQGQQRLDSYPRDVVKIFEDHNFIWGGKWSHFDILHFEYRPEIIIKSKYFVEQHEKIEPWYYGFPEGDKNVLKYIKIIEKALN